jgi:hypothetical protein
MGPDPTPRLPTAEAMHRLLLKMPQIQCTGTKAHIFAAGGKTATFKRSDFMLIVHVAITLSSSRAQVTL